MQTLNFSLTILENTLSKNSKWLSDYTFNFLLIVLVSLSFTTHQNAQTPTSNMVANYIDVDDNSNDYSSLGTGLGSYANSTNYNISFSSSATASNNLLLDYVEVGSETYFPTALVPTLTIRRNDNVTFTGIFEFLWFEQNSFTSPNVNLRPEFISTMIDALNSPIINRGSDNVFKNTSSNNGNNIERLDYVYSSGVTPADITKEGIALFERNGNDKIIIAPILSLDGANNPTSFGDLLVIDPGNTNWGSSSFNITTVTFRDDDPSINSSLKPNDNIGSQNIKSSLITCADMGITAGSTFYGYALFGGDVTNGGDNNNLLDWTNTTYYPTNTGDANGGADLIGGGIYVAASSLLPVTLNSFDVEQEDCMNRLTWESSAERNFKHFLVEKSEDGLHFSTIGTVNSNGNSNGSNYFFIDGDLDPTNYYRLKMVDQDNSYEYSKVLVSTNDCESQNTEIKVFPNPVTYAQKISINFDSDQTTTTITIYNLLGEIVKQMNLETSIGKNSITLNTADLEKNIYLLQVEGNKNTKRIVIQ